MESDENIKENEVSGPLQHLLSLKWEKLPDISSVTNDDQMDVKPLKQIKKVRFSEEIEQTYLDSDIDSNPDDSVDKCDIEDNVIVFDNNLKSLDTDIENLVLQPKTDSDEFLQDMHKSKDKDTENKQLDANELINEETISNYNEKINNSNELHHELSPSNQNKSIDLDSEDENFNDLNLEMQNVLTAKVKKEIDCKTDIENEIDPIHVENSSVLHVNKPIFHTDRFSGIDTNKDIDFEAATLLSQNKKTNQTTMCQKQTEKINKLLHNYNPKFSSVSEMNSIVIDAWSLVKKKNNRSSTIKKDDHNKKREKIMLTNKSTSKDAHTLWKMSLKKRKPEFCQNVKKNIKQSAISNASQEISKIDEEEKEMVFKSWKRQKDLQIKKEAERKYQEEQERSISLLMNEQLKKEDAQSAYLAWVAHKQENYKKEKMKQRWMLQKEKEIEEIKMQRDKEALEMYYLWLENKYSHRITSKSVENRPPWIPPTG